MEENTRPNVEETFEQLFQQKCEEAFELGAGSEEAKIASETIKNLAEAYNKCKAADNQEDANKENVRLNDSIIAKNNADIKLNKEKLESEKSLNDATIKEQKKEFWLGVAKVSATAAGTYVSLLVTSKIWSFTEAFEVSGTIRNKGTLFAQKLFEKAANRVENLRNLGD